MIKELGFLVFAFSASLSAMEINISNVNSDLGEFYSTFIAMQACTDIPPSGYFLTELRYVNSSTPCFGKWIYIFESHFDRPTGYQMTICLPTLLGTVPSNWYKVRDTVTTTCARRLGEAYGPAWIVQKG